MNNNIKNFADLILIIGKVSDAITASNITIDDMEELSLISEQLQAALQKTKPYFCDANGFESVKPWEATFPEDEWVKNDIWMVSNNGHIWDTIQNEPAKLVWNKDGLKIKTGFGMKRVSALVANSFGLKKTADEIFGYKNGDMRDNRIDNLYPKTKQKTDLEFNTLLIEDICRRIIEHNGHIPTILTKYEGINFITENYIRNIINKKTFVEISCKFFTTVGGVITPLTEYTMISNEGLDCFHVYQTSNDKEMYVALLKDKLKKSNKINTREQAWLIHEGRLQYGQDAAKIQMMINNEFGIKLSKQFIEHHTEFTKEA